MKRLLAVIAALCIAIPVEARVAVITSINENDIASSSAQKRVELFALEAIFAEYNVPYTVFQGAQAKTEYCRTGDFNICWPAWGGTAPTTCLQHYDAVVHVNYTRGSHFVGGGAYFPDSLTLARNNGASLPTVPQLFLCSSTSSSPQFNNSATCSTGIASSINYAATIAVDHGYAQYLVGTPFIWHQNGTQRAVRSAAALSSTWRGIIATNMTAMEDTMCGDCDSLYFRAATQAGAAPPDTVTMWEIMNQSPTSTPWSVTRSPNIFCMPGGAQAIVFTPNVLMALAILDSASGNRVFTDKSRLPLKIAFHIDDGWMHRGRSVSSGIFLPDSDSWKASVDSLVAYKIPVTLGVDTDSLEFNREDSTWAVVRGAPYFHFTLHTHSGLGGERGSRRGLNPYKGDDLWGINRSYTRLYNGSPDSTTALADTTFFQMVRQGFRRLEALAPGRVDHFGMPPTDAWLPRATTGPNPTQMLRQNAGPGMDSLMWVWNQAGGVGMRSNASCSACGYFADEAVAQNSFDWNRKVYSVFSSPNGGTPATWPVKPGGDYANNSVAIPTAGPYTVLARQPIVFTSGYPTSGSTSIADAVPQFMLNEQAVFLGFGGINPSAAGPGGSATRSDVVKCRIMVEHENSFGGDPTGARNNSQGAKRTGWWEFKWAWNVCQAVNTLGGRSIYTVDYAENVARQEANR